MSATNFKYKRYDNYLRPVIPVEFRYQDHPVVHEVLLDTGADFCILDAQIGELLGITIEEGEETSFIGVTGKSKKGYLHEIWMSVANTRYRAKVIFAKGIAQKGYSILGQLGFFELFSVKFDYKDRQIVVRRS